MDKLYDKIGLVKDTATREALTLIADELKRIHSIKPVSEGNTKHAQAINQIIGRFK